MLSVTCNFPHRDDASHLQSFADVDHPSKMTSPTLFEQLTTKQDLILYPSPLQPFLIPSICCVCVCVCVCVWCVCVLSKSLPRSNSLSISSSAIPDLLNLIGCLLHTCMCVLLPNSLQLHGCVCVCVCVCVSVPNTLQRHGLLCGPTGSSVHGICQANISYSRGSF